MKVKIAQLKKQLASLLEQQKIIKNRMTINYWDQIINLVNKIKKESEIAKLNGLMSGWKELEALQKSQNKNYLCDLEKSKDLAKKINALVSEIGISEIRQENK